MSIKIMDNLRDFIDSAERSRKYPPNTAIALKNALKVFENELNEDEATNLELFKQHLDQIYHSVFEKNKNRMSVGSLATYRARVNRVLKDFDNYGSDPAKFNSWSVSIKPRTTRKKPANSTATDDSSNDTITGITENSSLASPRVLPSGIVILFPKELDANVTFGEFGKELKELDNRAKELLEGSNDAEAQDSN